MSKVRVSKGQLSRSCEGCGSTFWIYPYRKNEARFCSHKCRRTIHDQTCEICGIVFKPTNVGARFCSSKCYGESEIGRMPWNSGLKADEDERVRRSLDAAHAACRGRLPWNKGKKVGPSWNSGKLITTNTGRTHWKKGRVPWNKGKPMVRGPAHWNWKGGPDNELVALRKTLEYRQWRQSVFRRDRYTCVICHRSGVTINADHIKPFSLYPELRLELSNGRTLCKPCHIKTDTWGRKGKGKHQVV